VAFGAIDESSNLSRATNPRVEETALSVSTMAKWTHKHSSFFFVESENECLKPFVAFGFCLVFGRLHVVVDLLIA
jgi:hypothetical protein